MTDRARILALAADYDTAPTKAAKAVRRAKLLESVKVDGFHRWGLPGNSSDNNATRVVSRWVAASRRAAANPTRRKGPAVPPGRTERISVPATPATKAAIEGRAKRTGRSVATVAGDVLEGWADNVNAPKGDEVKP